MTEWLLTILKVIFRWRTFLTEQEYNAVEYARLQRVAAMRIRIVSVDRYGTEHGLLNVQASEAYLIAKYGGYSETEPITEIRRCGCPYSTQDAYRLYMYEGTPNG